MPLSTAYDYADSAVETGKSYADSAHSYGKQAAGKGTSGASDVATGIIAGQLYAQSQMAELGQNTWDATSGFAGNATDWGGLPGFPSIIPSSDPDDSRDRPDDEEPDTLLLAGAAVLVIGLFTQILS